jgi:hypothetical protein
MANSAAAISDGGPSPVPKTQRNRVAGIFLGIISARLIPMGSGFWAQIVSLPQSVPCGGDRILNAHHISAFPGEDVNRPVRVKHSIDPIRYLDIGHILASGEAADFLECYPLQLMSSNERFGHRAGPLNQSILSLLSSVLKNSWSNWGWPALVPPQKINPLA